MSIRVCGMKQLMWHPKIIFRTRLILACDMTHLHTHQKRRQFVHRPRTYSCVWHGVFVRGLRLIHKCDMTQFIVFVRVKWITSKKEVVRDWVAHSVTRVTWLVHVRVMTHSYVFIRGTMTIHKCDMTQLISFVHVTRSIRKHTLKEEDAVRD